MILDKCIVLRILTLTGCPLCRERHPMCRLKNHTVIKIWLLVGFHPATRSVESTPADNTRKRVWQSIEKEKRKKERSKFNITIIRNFTRRNYRFWESVPMERSYLYMRSGDFYCSWGGGGSMRSPVGKPALHLDHCIIG